MSAFGGPGFFPISEAMQGMSLFIELFGIIANTFFLVMLLRFIPKWPAGKVLLFSYHLSALLFLCGLFFPMVVIISNKTGYTPEQCVAPAVLLQLTGTFQILSLALMAHVRWRIIDCERRADPGSAPDAKRYTAGLCVFVALVIIAVHIQGEVVDAPFMFLWRVLLCARVNDAWSVVFYMTFFCTAPYVFFCYRRVIKTIREMVDGSQKSNAAKEPVRLIYTLTLVYYLTHLPFYVIFFTLQNSNATIATPTYQAWKLLQVSYSSLVPFLSIILTKKYLRTARSILTCQTVINTHTTKSSGGSINHSINKSTTTTLVEVKGAIEVDVVPTAT